MYQRLMAVLALATVMGAAGCQKKTGAPPGEQKAQATPDAPAASSTSVYGVWTVVGYYVPEMTSMTQADADVWMGRSLLLSATEFSSGDVHCSTPVYNRVTMTRDDFLGMDAGFPQGALMRLANVDPLTLTNVSCGGEPLSAMGRLIIEVDPDHILAPLEGVFFELARETAR